jgi:hypothetical protein
LDAIFSSVLFSINFIRVWTGKGDPFTKEAKALDTEVQDYVFLFHDYGTFANEWIAEANALEQNMHASPPFIPYYGSL